MGGLVGVSGSIGLSEVGLLGGQPLGAAKKPQPAHEPYIGNTLLKSDAELQIFLAAALHDA